MADEQKHHDQEAITPTTGKPEELSEKDLDKASGGTIGSVTGQKIYEKWIEIAPNFGGEVE